jgi:hypothetical protein
LIRDGALKQAGTTKIVAGNPGYSMLNGSQLDQENRQKNYPKKGA